jgi:hypothetical protein
LVAETRTDQILSHLAAYHVSIREIMETHLFRGKKVARELWELSTGKGLIAVHQALANRRSYYQLTRRGASKLGLSEHWARPLGAQSLIANLSLAWFCCMGTHERRRLRRTAVARAYGCDVPGVYHCVEKGDSRHRVYRVYVPMPGTPPREIMRALGEIVDRATATPGLDKVIERREYGFAVLVETQLRVEAIRHRLKTHDARDGIPLAGFAHFRVEAVPEFLEAAKLRGSNVRVSAEEEEHTG